MTLYQSQPLAKEFERITHKPLFELLCPIWMADGQCLPDPIKIDQWLQTPAGTSTKDQLTMLYGPRATQIIETLLNS
jgi:hypothetical protein